MSNEDAEYFDHFSINTTFHVAGLDGELHEAKAAKAVTADSLGPLVHAAVQASSVTTGNLCLVTFATGQPETFTSREHLIPEGLGFPWAALPLGIGTCDRINLLLGRAELQWLRFGTLGAFRPFFVGRGKDSPPEFHAPRRSTAVFSLVRGPDGERQLEIHTERELELPDATGRAEFRIRTTAADANSTSVALATHKLAYLACWLTHPQLALAAPFDAVRGFLASPAQENHRTVLERMVSGGPPQVTVNLRVFARETEPTEPGNDRAASVEGVHVVLRVHHMLYVLALVGETPVPSEADWTARDWEPLDFRPPERPVEFVFRADSSRQR